MKSSSTIRGTACSYVPIPTVAPAAPPCGTGREARNENGTCVQTDYSDNKNDDSSPMHFTYSVNGNTLTMTESTGEFQNVFQIKKLSQSQLVLFRSGEDAHEKFEETETYKRIK